MDPRTEDPGTGDPKYLSVFKSAQAGFLLYYQVSLSELRLQVMHLILNIMIGGVVGNCHGY